MEGANSITNWTLDCTEYLGIQVRSMPLKVHMHIVEKAPFHLLLGHPFQCVTLCCLEDLPGGKVKVSIRDPADLAQCIYIPSRPQKVHIGCLWVLSVLAYDDTCIFIKPLL
jgi:hypothetical protein